MLKLRSFLQRPSCTRAGVLECLVAFLLQHFDLGTRDSETACTERFLVDEFFLEPRTLRKERHTLLVQRLPIVLPLTTLFLFSIAIAHDLGQRRDEHLACDDVLGRHLLVSPNPTPGLGSSVIARAPVSAGTRFQALGPCRRRSRTFSLPVPPAPEPDPRVANLVIHW